MGREKRKIDDEHKRRYISSDLLYTILPLYTTMEYFGLYGQDRDITGGEERGKKPASSGCRL